ncbi:polysaccharide pyruvyl transferase family protein [Gordonia sp. zg691]|uniref:polysaccharide pyruvyl transferase family protein n=1 Tax=Gordonia jinghuaiqii TaxID=2758710 RepID=UPI00166276FF|nr:polysaccharide pyruvyl transferase family protein [Gordonia jinghuaiqii]MBD0863954.1 polysaccharide pyruvyl transferase family protein [Gordonia jinghuaiqii]
MLSSVRTSLAPRLKGVARAALDRPWAFSVIDVPNRVAFAAGRQSRRLRLSRTRGAVTERVIVVAPPGGGNIGDQALVESAIWNAGGPVALVVRASSDFQLPDWVQARDVEVIVLPNLVYGVGPRHLRDLIELGKRVDGASRMLLVGADIMDGNYNLVASMNRWSVANAFGRSSGSSTVLGFSWSDAARPSCVKAAQVASASCRLWLRDPVSLSRIASVGLRGEPTLCADIVFAHPAPSLPPSVRELPADLRQFIANNPEYVVLNMSGLVGGDDRLIDHYVRVVERLRADGISLILLPHVVRSTKSDNVYLKDLAARFDDRRIILVNELLTPSQVFEVCRGGLVVLTGRMHLAVLASLSGTPSSTLSTQGKVAGLYEHLRSPEGAIEVDSDVSGMFFARLEQVVNRTEGIDTELRRYLKELAMRSFDSPQFRPETSEPVHSLQERAS